jgi:HlyD family secretion protein
VLLENKADVLMIKRGAFVQSGGGKFAYIVNQNTASMVNIEVGASSISHVELINGVKEGDRLVISSLDTFKQAKQVLIR